MRKYTTENFITKSEKVHGSKFDYSKSIYKNSVTEIVISCPIHGDFHILPVSHLQGRGCKKCGIISRSNKRRHTTKWFINNAYKIHGETYNYSKSVYVNSHTDVFIICPIHGEFLQNPYAHLRGLGCSRCSGKCKSTTEEFIQKAIIIHGYKYDYSSVDYKSALEKIKIICKIHKEFFQTPNAHLNGSGCLKCGFVKTANFRRKTTDQFIKESRDIHGLRYKYENSIYIGNHKKLEIICPLHGSFWQTPHMHLHRDKCGCPKCNFSKGEQAITSYLDKNNITYECQKIFDDCRNPKTNYPLKFDFFIPSKNLLIEYDGSQHFVFGKKLGNYITTEDDMKNIKFRDMIKSKYAKLKNIRLLRIKYTKLAFINKILEFELEH